MQGVVQVVFVAVFVTAALAWEQPQYQRLFPKPEPKKEPYYYYDSQYDDRPKDWKPSRDNKRRDYYYYDTQYDDRANDLKPIRDNKQLDYYYYDSQDDYKPMDWKSNSDYEQRDYNNDYYYPSQPRVPDSTNSGYAYDTQYYEPRSANPKPVLELNGNLKLYDSRRRNSPFLRKLTRQDYFY